MSKDALIEKSLERIRSGAHSRAELTRIRANAEAKLREGAQGAERILEAIQQARPKDDFIVFMGFCLGGQLENRLDQEWKENGTCTFHFHDSAHQVEAFNNIMIGDLIVLKKRHQFGKTMQLFGHGRVTGVRFGGEGNRELLMSWANQNEVIEVPLMGCNSTVDIRSIETVEAEMPETFYAWLGESA